MPERAQPICLMLVQSQLVVDIAPAHWFEIVDAADRKAAFNAGFIEHQCGQMPARRPPCDIEATRVAAIAITIVGNEADRRADFVDDAVERNIRRQRVTDHRDADPVRERPAREHAEILLGAHLPVAAVDEYQYRAGRLRGKIIDAIARRRAVAQIQIARHFTAQAVGARAQVRHQRGAVGDRRAVVIRRIERSAVHATIKCHAIPSAIITPCGAMTTRMAYALLQPPVSCDKSPMSVPYSLALTELLPRMRAGTLTPTQLARDVLAAAADGDRHNTWICRLTDDAVLAQARRIESLPAARELPLYGVPFAVKDNIDVAGQPTTAACPAFKYTGGATATAVQRLLDAGAILIGKTNLDQFATGLVGTRSPYGAGKNAFDARYISGGSSSGSALAVALNLVSFSLGTDTAGSGRVPAGFNNIVGLKPTRGSISTAGVVPACRTLDCVSIFALTAGDAWDVYQIARGYDMADAYSRSPPPSPHF